MEIRAGTVCMRAPRIPHAPLLWGYVQDFVSGTWAPGCTSKALCLSGWVLERGWKMRWVTAQSNTAELLRCQSQESCSSGEESTLSSMELSAVDQLILKRGMLQEEIRSALCSGGGRGADFQRRSKSSCIHLPCGFLYPPQKRLLLNTNST